VEASCRKVSPVARAPARPSYRDNALGLEKPASLTQIEAAFFLVSVASRYLAEIARLGGGGSALVQPIFRSPARIPEPESMR